MTADERREEILEAALICFADHGAHGMSTEAIAKAVGISQPYIFRLFGTKKELVKATIDRCLRGTLEMLRTAAGASLGTAAHPRGAGLRARDAPERDRHDGSPRRRRRLGPPADRGLEGFGMSSFFSGRSK